MLKKSITKFFNERGNCLPLFLVIIVTAAVFAYSCTFPVMESWDDDGYVLNNMSRLSFSIKNIIYWLRHCFWGNYTPLVMFSYMADYNISGIDGSSYHVQNLLWHIIAVSGVFYCFRQLKINTWLCVIGALFFAIHPQRVESVVWVAERRDVMCGAFYFWALFFYIKNNEYGRMKILPFVLYACALLSKPMAVSLPFIFALYDFHVFRETKIKYYLKKFWPAFLVAALITLITAAQQMNSVREISVLRKILIIAYNYMWYFSENFIPYNLCPIYPALSISPALIVSLIIFYLSAFIIVLIIFRKNRDWALYSVLPLICAYIISLAPVAGFCKFGSAIFERADRYNYLPSIFLTAWLLLLIRRYRDKIQLGRLYSAVSIICLAIFGLYSFYYSLTWKSYEALLRSCVLYNPPNNSTLRLLAFTEIQNSNYQQAAELADFIRAFRQEWMSERDISENILISDFIKASIEYKSGDSEKALKMLHAVERRLVKSSLAKDSGIVKSLCMALAEAYLARGNKAMALKYYENIIPFLSDRQYNYEYYFFSGICLLLSGKDREALSSFEKAHQLKPDNERIIHNIQSIKERISGISH
ncbi:MAG: hypothetical protein A2017_01575 [Lentisphaerae bacterium GWF2_44_16]|nr:MAG: hypothetical protein A2017_01575 [Lentisphaerae bacterium GWF2_44_16]